MHPKDLSIADFTYVLPPERIAQYPLPDRDQSKLLVYDKGKISHNVFANLTDHLPENATIVFNDTKVIHARVIFKNENEANIEVFLLEPSKPHTDMQLAMFEHAECVWRCLVRNVKKWREDFLSKKIRIGNEEVLLEVRLIGKIEDDFLLHFSWKPNKFSFVKALEAAGAVPLPPYIKRDISGEDEERYQTTYAVQDGSVAAPTAGLHFTESLFEKLHAKNIHPLFVTLHVSAGTFLPVKAEQMSGHRMHGEQMVIRKEVIEDLLKRKEEPLICVGTTSMRTIESLYWLGRKLLREDESLIVEQWEPYEISDLEFGISDCLGAILNWMEKRKMNQLIAETKLLITPGYEFKFADGLITNFHLPQSTLLLLIAAFIGDDWRKIYDYALKNDFRFLSYGDGSLLWGR